MPSATPRMERATAVSNPSTGEQTGWQRNLALLPFLIVVVLFLIFGDHLPLELRRYLSALFR